MNDPITQSSRWTPPIYHSNVEPNYMTVTGRGIAPSLIWHNAGKDTAVTGMLLLWIIIIAMVIPVGWVSGSTGLALSGHPVEQGVTISSNNPPFGQSVGGHALTGSSIPHIDSIPDSVNAVKSVVPSTHIPSAGVNHVSTLTELSIPDTSAGVPELSSQAAQQSTQGNGLTAGAGYAEDFVHPWTSYTATFAYTGYVQTWAVPSGVTSITVDMAGAAGESGTAASGGTAGTGGNGGRVQATISVTPGTTLDVAVGGVGGWPGGGAGGSCSYGNGGSGGGYSALNTSSGEILAIAGGGGGGGGVWYEGNGGNGGDGATSGTGFGTSGGDGTYGGGGGGGTSSGGGAGGAAGDSAAGGAGTYLVGGDGGNSCGYDPIGGGGGGGYYGGGGGGDGYILLGGAGGGGGGDSCVPSAGSCSSSATYSAYESGDGYVDILAALVAGTVSASDNPADVDQSVTFTSTAAVGGGGTYTYSWNNLPTGTGCTSANSLTITCAPTTTTGSPFPVSITVTDSNSNTATSSALSFAVDPALVVPAPIVTQNPADAGQSVTFTASPSGGSGSFTTYGWSGFPAGCTSSNSATVTCTPSSTTGSPFSVKVAVTDSNSNTVTSSALSFTVDPALVVPAPSATHNPADVGQSVTFTASPSGGSGSFTTYAWSGLPTGCVASNIATITCAPSTIAGSPFSTTVAVTDSNSNTVASTALSFTVDPALVVPAPSVTQNPADVGQSVTFTASPSGGSNSFTTYAWSGLPTGCAASNSATITCSPSTTTGSPFSVCVAVTDSNSNTATSSALSFAVDPKLVVPIPTVTQNPADVGQSVTFTASPSGGSSSFTTYAWSGLPTGCAASNSATITCAPSTTTGSPFSVSVAVTDSNSNTVTSSALSFAVDPVLVAGTVSVDRDPVDVGQSITFTATPASGGYGSYTYSWIGLPAGCTSVNGLTITCSPTTATGSPFSVTVAVVDSNADMVTSPALTLTVDPTLVVPIPIVTHNPADAGQSVSFTAAPSGGSGTYINYSWSGLPTGCPASNSATITCAPSTATGSPFSVTVAVNDSNGFTVNSSSLSFAVDTALVVPAPSVTHNPADVGQSITFTVSPSGGSNSFTTYAWRGLPAGCTPSNSAIITCASSTTAGSPFSISVAVTDSNSNRVTSSTLSFAVDPALVVPAPTAAHNPTDVGLSVTFTASPSGGSGSFTTYAWSGLPTGCTTSNSATVTCVPSTTTGSPFSVAVAITDSNSNTVASLPLSFTVNAKLALVSFTAEPPTVASGSTTYLNISVSGGTSPYTYSYGSLPSGCSSSNVASLACTSIAVGNYTVSVTVNDAVGDSVTATTTLTITRFVSQLEIASFTVSPASILLGASANFTVKVSGGIQPYAYAYPSLPPGCSSVNESVLQCTPSATGSFTVSAKVTDARGKTAVASTLLTVNASASTLTSVTVSPISASLVPSGTTTFTATAVCTEKCPAGTTYSWTLTREGMGAFSATTGSPVTFIAGSVTGNLALFVNATLNGLTKQSYPVFITILSSSVPTIASVSISPASANISIAGTQVFTATPECTGGPCPAGTTYSWTLTNDEGSVGPTTGPTVNFTAGSSSGVVVLFVNATLNGLTRTNHVTITMTRGPGPGSTPFFSGTTMLIVLAVIAVIVAILVVLLLVRRRRTTAIEPSSSQPVSDVPFQPAPPEDTAPPGAPPLPMPPEYAPLAAPVVAEEAYQPEPEQIESLPAPSEYASLAAPAVKEEIRQPEPEKAESAPAPEIQVGETEPIIVTPSIAKQSEPESAPEDAEVSEIERELEKAQASLPKPQPEEPKTKQETSAAMVPTGNASKNKCFICGSELQGDYCSLCDMHWDEHEPRPSTK